jgi:hypothetical protein
MPFHINVLYTKIDGGLNRQAECPKSMVHWDGQRVDESVGRCIPMCPWRSAMWNKVSFRCKHRCGERGVVGASATRDVMRLFAIQS